VTGGFVVLSESAVTAAFDMKRRVMFAACCVLVWLSVVFFIQELTPVVRLVRGQNNNTMEQHKEDRLERPETTKTEETEKDIRHRTRLNYVKLHWNKENYL